MEYTYRWVVILAVCLIPSGSARSQEGDATAAPPPAGQKTHQDDYATLLSKLAERIDAMEAQHAADLERIGQLEARLDQFESPQMQEQRAEQIEQLREKMAAESSAAPGTGWFGLSGSGYGATNELNPALTVFFDLGGSISSRGRNKALNRFNFREAELDLRAAISPSADGVMIVSLGEDIASRRSGEVDIDREVDIEEGYIYFHSLPHDMSLKIGKFRSVFGRNNLLHTHDLPQVTRPPAVVAFLGPEGLLTTGASWSWLVPNPWDKYIEAQVEVVNADGGTESPILGGSNADNPAVIVHVKYFDDLTETSSIELGGSYLYGHSSSRSDFDANMFGFDVTYLWTDPDPSTFHSFVLQSEAFWANNDRDRGFFGSSRNSSFGAYAFGQYQLNQDWYVGLRGDYTDFPNSESRSARDWDFSMSPYVTYYLTEFLRARLEYQQRFFHLGDDTTSEEVVFLQFTGVIGAHPPHPYWVNR